jgi:hypothetical protein
MNTQKHNGWTNYETWLVKLWMDNEEGSQTYWREQAKEALHNPGSHFSAVLTKEECASAALADSLMAAHEEALPELMAGFASDLLNAAMCEVNWSEIAQGLIDDVKEGARP